MISCPSVTQPGIRSHYDLATLFYRLLWGRHIHHGLWEADESPVAAQENLIRSLASAAGIHAGESVLDVGCGMGGSSIHLARELNCRVTGVTLSGLQRGWASLASRIAGTAAQTTFIRADAEQLDIPPASCDVVWSVECTEHLFDKPRFFARAAEWLRPGGRLAICAWLASDDSDTEKARAVYDVCEGFLCPSLGTRNDYCQWLADAGCTLKTSLDWTDRVWRTWEICERRVQRSRVRWLARLVDRKTVRFLDRFETILNAYRSGAMQYGCFVAQKPGA